jgi:hypothetical protein
MTAGFAPRRKAGFHLLPHKDFVRNYPRRSPSATESNLLFRVMTVRSMADGASLPIGEFWREDLSTARIG